MDDQEKKKITRHTELEVYQKAFAAAMRIFELSKSFPVEERYSLTDQVRRSSRSVCANQAEAWRKRIYKAHFASKLNDSEAEAACPCGNRPLTPGNSPTSFFAPTLRHLPFR